jgi:hypothetical protein
MEERRFAFDWQVPAAGHEWVHATATGPGPGPGAKRSGPALIAARAPGTLNESAGFRPSAEPMLFRLLAETDAPKDGILQLANRFGNLFSGEELSLVSKKGKPNNVVVQGVFLRTWQEQIDALWCLTALWDSVQKQDVEALARCIHWDDEGSPLGPYVYYRSPRREDGGVPAFGGPRGIVEIATSESDPGPRDLFPPGDLLGPAELFLQQKLNEALGKTTDGVRVGMAWDARRGQPAVAYHCPSLLSAVWLQFATVVNENLTFGRCRECAKWFEVAPDVSRASRRFCSTACRSKAYRERQDRARQLFAAGKSFEAIGAELESDIKAVKRWITGSK